MLSFGVVYGLLFGAGIGAVLRMVQQDALGVVETSS
jgi:hypothetical protein